MECFKCGVSGERIRLFDAISREGIVKVCKECASEEDMPIIKKPVGFLPGEEEKETIRRVLSRISGVKSIEKPKEVHQALKEQEIKLKEIADANFQKSIQEKPVSTKGLVDNFHWVIMRIRRSKKITQEELAEAITEPEAAIKMAEQGIISSLKLIEKLENYLNIKLRKDEEDIIIHDVKKSIPIESQEKSKTELSFDPTITKSLTIADLKGIKKKREEDIPRKEEKEKPFEERALTDKDIDDILFGRK